jgi:hypothetical protein
MQPQTNGLVQRIGTLSHVDYVSFRVCNLHRKNEPKMQKNYADVISAGRHINGSRGCSPPGHPRIFVLPIDSQLDAMAWRTEGVPHDRS